MLTSLFPAPIAETLERISPDILHLEQYMDFVRNRQFRQTLLCHRDLRPNRALSPGSLHGLLVSSAARAGSTPVDLTQGTAVVFSKDSQSATGHARASKAAMIVLAGCVAASRSRGRVVRPGTRAGNTVSARGPDRRRPAAR